MKVSLIQMNSVPDKLQNCADADHLARLNPGDIILCDENGVLVIPPEEVEEIAAMALAKQRRGTENIKKLGQGAKLGDLSGANKFIEQDVAA